MPRAPRRTTILDARAVARALRRMAVEVLDLAPRAEDLVLIGIQRRGVELAERLAKLIEQEENVTVARGALDTVRAALDELADFGRPKRISLCVLVDRGGRELPIRADVIGKALRAAPGDRVDVQIVELDGVDQVDLVQADKAP